tara:strand:+ start:239 stop:622 length:384 start_codon:yes stop_codon:yes gene_type:complete
MSRSSPDKCDFCGLEINLVRHHIYGREWEGANKPENIAWVCGYGNDSGCHGILHNNPSPQHNHPDFNGQYVPVEMRIIPGDCSLCKERLYWNRINVGNDGVMYLMCRSGHILVDEELDEYLTEKENG